MLRRSGPQPGFQSTPPMSRRVSQSKIPNARFTCKMFDSIVTIKASQEDHTVIEIKAHDHLNCDLSSAPEANRCARPYSGLSRRVSTNGIAIHAPSLVDCAIRRARNKEAAQLPQSRIPVPIEAEIVIALD